MKLFSDWKLKFDVDKKWIRNKKNHLKISKSKKKCINCTKSSTLFLFFLKFNWKEEKIDKRNPLKFTIHISQYKNFVALLQHCCGSCSSNEKTQNVYPKYFTCSQQLYQSQQQINKIIQNSNCKQIFKHWNVWCELFTWPKITFKCCCKCSLSVVFFLGGAIYTNLWRISFVKHKFNLQFLVFWFHQWVWHMFHAVFLTKNYSFVLLSLLLLLYFCFVIFD